MSPGGRDLPDRDRPDEDVDAAFARIIAGWEDVATLPDRDGPTGASPAGSPTSAGPVAGTGAPVPLPPAPVEPAAPTGPTGPRDFAPAPEAEEGYVPPDPPPLPRGDLLTALPWVAVVVGPLILVLAGLFWRSASPLWLGLAVVCFVGGFVALVMRLPLHHDDEDDDGAVV